MNQSSAHTGVKNAIIARSLASLSILHDISEREIRERSKRDQREIKERSKRDQKETPKRGSQAIRLWKWSSTRFPSFDFWMPLAPQVKLAQIVLHCIIILWQFNGSGAHLPVTCRNVPGARDDSSATGFCIPNHAYSLPGLPHSLIHLRTFLQGTMSARCCASAGTSCTAAPPAAEAQS